MPLTPLASCLMPTANRRRFVPGAITRFLAQDYANAELIILDDGEDAVADLVPSHPKIRYLRGPRHRSLGEKRNQAAAAAQGEILLHWDDDDWYAPERIGLQVRALQNSGADVCGIDRAFFVDPGRRAAWEYVYPQGNGQAPWVCGATLCYRRDYWQTHRFTGLQVGEDTAFAAAVPPQRLHILPDNRFFAALIHQDNTSPKHVHDRRWQPADFGTLLSRTGSFWEAAPSAGIATRGSALVAAAGGIGDILRVTPLIRALHLLGHAVDVLLAPDNPQAADLLRGAAEIASLHVVPDTTPGIAGPLPPELTGTRYRLAAFTRWAAPLAPQIAATSSLHFNPADWLAQGDSACVAALARAAGWQGELPAPFARHSKRDFALPAGTVGLHPGCKPGWPWKRWHGFADLAAQLEHVLLLGTEADRDGAGSYFEPLQWPPHVLDFCGKLSLADTAALISQCGAVVANDSGMMHLAAVLGVPTIGIFGITSPQREAMKLPTMHVLTKGLPCEPACRREPWGRRDCAQHLACLKTLTPDEVIGRLDSVLKEPAAMLDQIAPALLQAAPPQPAVRLALAVHMEGGVGDVILAARLVEAAYRSLGHCDIDVYYKNPEVARFVFHDTSFVRHFYPAASGRLPLPGYDLSVSTLHYAGFTVHNPAHLSQHFPDVAERLGHAAERFAAHRGLFEKRPHLDGLWGRISASAGRNALDNLGFCSGLDVSRATELVLNPDAAALAMLPAMLGGAEHYITIHDGFDNSMTIPPGGATKCWTLEGWTAFIRAFKADHPAYRVVQLGGNKSRAIAGVDINLIGRTSLHQAAWILKSAALHVDTDSGLVHLADAVHTKAVVLFGPTDPLVYGHDKHVAVIEGDCSACWWSTADWLAHCPRGLKQPACMAAITPERVLRQSAEVLEHRRPPKAEMIGARLYEGALMRRDEAVLQAVFADAGLVPVPITAHARNTESGVYLHASKQWEYLLAIAAIRDLGQRRLRVLDAGGGRGALAFHLAAQGHQVEVIDRDFLWDHGGDEDIERRFMQSPTGNLRFRHGGLHNLPVADECVDVVTCISVVEHLREKPMVLRELLRVLRPGGLLVLTFDIASAPEGFEDQSRVEIFSPESLSAFLQPICGKIAPFSDTDAVESAERIQADGVAGIPNGMTVGGIVLRKWDDVSPIGERHDFLEKSSD